MHIKTGLPTIALLAWALCGCAGHFAESTGMDWGGKPGSGTISVSDPKMYRREALANERREDTAWIETLLKNSETVEFKPEIAREIEQITALSAALGLSFDPAAGVNYRRARETGDLSQQIDTMRLQLQLDQLRRDAEIVRSKFESQTEPVNADLGKLSGSGAVAANSTTAATAATQLTAAIDKLTAAMTSRLDADGKPVALPTYLGANPADVFRDRSAYRETLNSALNAASLDELQDFNASALIRLNFQATIFPDRPNANVPGVVQMRVVAPVISEERVARLYRDWLDYVNDTLNVEQVEGWAPDPSVLRSAAADDFDVVQFRYATPAKPRAPEASSLTGVPSRRTKSKSPAKATHKTLKPNVTSGVPPTPACEGLVIDSSKKAPDGCATLYFAVPKFLGLSAAEGTFKTLQSYLDSFDLDLPDSEEADKFVAARSVLVNHPQALVSGCDAMPFAAPAGLNQQPSPERNAYLLLLRARVRLAGGDVIVGIDRRARRMLAERGYAAPDAPDMTRIAARTAQAQLLLLSLESIYKSCTPDQITAFRRAGPGYYIPPEFHNVATDDDGRVAVYDVGPREQVQQTSTVARSANSLALAVSIAASAPSSGLGVNAAGGFSKQETGKAAALERLPAVVGYSVQSKQTFGWVIGPRATVNAKGRIELDQSLRSYDLAVDLSVPSWWPWFCLERTTAWAPRPDAIVAASVSDAGSIAADERLVKDCQVSKTAAGKATAFHGVKVNLSPNDADFALLTDKLAHRGADVRRRAALKTPQFAGQTVNACLATTLVIGGDAVWRTNAVLIDGYQLTGSAISIAPNMGGVLVEVPALDGKIRTPTTAKVPLRVLTPYGDAAGQIDYVPKPVGGCSGEKKPDGASVTSVTPISFAAPSVMTFEVNGKKLDQIDRVTMNGQDGKFVARTGASSGKAYFTLSDSQGLPVSKTVPLTFYKGDDKVGEVLLEVTSNSGGK